MSVYLGPGNMALGSLSTFLKQEVHIVHTVNQKECLAFLLTVCMVDQRTLYIKMVGRQVRQRQEDQLQWFKKKNCLLHGKMCTLY